MIDELNLMGHMSKIMDLSKDTGINADLFEKARILQNFSNGP
jgi:hypothetical protein